MKKLIGGAFVTGVLVLFMVSACSSVKTLSNGKKIDTQLVGTWEGSETGVQMEDTKKEWKMIRDEDGTFVLHFKTTTDGEVDEFTEDGTWWVEGNRFFEYHSNSENTDTYEYTVLDKQRVQFKMLNSAMNFNEKEYVFIDTKVVGTKTKKGVKDGLSIENAIKVNSIDEEYAYVRKNCEGCKRIRQSLLDHKGKPYDALHFQKPNGEEVIYYFDISSFFGKW